VEGDLVAAKFKPRRQLSCRRDAEGKSLECDRTHDAVLP